MFHIILSLMFHFLVSPAMASDVIREYDVRICNFSRQAVVAWEVQVWNAHGWRSTRLRIAPGEERRIMLGFGTGENGSGSISQAFVGVSGNPVGRMTMLHHRTFSYPAFIVEELYVRVFGEVSLGEGEEQSILVRVGRVGQQVLCRKSRRESELWFFF